jgi:hypothetical protein
MASSMLVNPAATSGTLAATQMAISKMIEKVSFLSVTQRSFYMMSVVIDNGDASIGNGYL